jgi:hypothetical protein
MHSMRSSGMIRMDGILRMKNDAALLGGTRKRKGWRGFSRDTLTTLVMIRFLTFLLVMLIVDEPMQKHDI